MAELLKNRYGPQVVHHIALAVTQAVQSRGDPEESFDEAAFCVQALQGYEALSLTQRAAQIAVALRAHLPVDYRQALAVLMRSLGPPLASSEAFGLGPFVYLPHVNFVGRYGLDPAHLEASLQAQYELTQRFTAEFSIRPFLERHPEVTLARLRQWAADPNEHVRRLVSEGTRPRLPWAGRLREFQRDPSPVLALLELLKDDPSLYVRRSVANNLNDIGKDHPALLVATARRWLAGSPSAERRWIVSHALRSAVKRGDEQALAVLGYGAPTQGIRVSAAQVQPARARLGERVQLDFTLTHTGTAPVSVMVDFAIHYVKANGQARPKVFKLRTVELAPHQPVHLSKSVALREMTTRRHHPGLHRVEVILNGEARELGQFELLMP